MADTPGLSVGHAEAADRRTGSTVVLCERLTPASVDVRGGAPGTRDISALDPSCLVDGVHGIVLSGGSVFGLDAAGGVTSFLAERGIGLNFGRSALRIPVVPSAMSVTT